MTSIGFPQKFDKNVSYIIATFLTPIPKQLLDWIDPKKITWIHLVTVMDTYLLHKYSEYVVDVNLAGFAFPEIVEFLQDCPKFIDWRSLSWNPCAVHLLEQNKDKIDWEEICRNINAIHLIREYTKNMTQNVNKVMLDALCANENAVELIEAYTCNMKQRLNIQSNVHNNLVNLNILCKNPNAIPLIRTFIGYSFLNKKKVNWQYLSSNPNAIELLKDNLDKIDWFMIAGNKNVVLILKCLKLNDLQIVLENEIHWDYLSSNHGVIPFLVDLYKSNKVQFLHKVNWRRMCYNPESIPFLEQVTQNFTTNLNLLDWEMLSQNSNAFRAMEKITNNFTTKLDLINWSEFCLNKNPKIIPILEKHVQKIKWINFSRNPNAMNLIINCKEGPLADKKNIDDVYLQTLSLHDSVFEIDNKEYNVRISNTINFVYNL